MSLDLLNTFATFGTFIVIAATAIAAIFQLRHARGSNQIAAITELRESQETPGFVKAAHFIHSGLPSLMQNPAFRHQLANKSARTGEYNAMIADVHAIGNFYENMGVLVKTRLVDREILLNIDSQRVVNNWHILADVTAILRRHLGPTAWENFEYLTVLSEDWLATHEAGNYPRGVRRLAITDTWRSADEQEMAPVY